MIRLAEAADMPEIRALWEVCFPDDTGFNAYYFQHTFSLDATAVSVQEGRIAAMVQMLPYTLLSNGNGACNLYLRCLYTPGFSPPSLDVGTFAVELFTGYTAVRLQHLS